MTRTPTHHYEDPLDHIWINTAAHIGLTIHRSDEAFAFADGRGNLFIGSPETLDADDCLAQMIFHEICHAQGGLSDSGLPIHLLDFAGRLVRRGWRSAGIAGTGRRGQAQLSLYVSV